MPVPEFTPEELESEEWRPVAEWESRYFISSLGRVKNNQGQILRPHSTKGYYIITLAAGNRDNRKSPRVHHLVALAFLGPRPAGYQVNHKDGHKLNNRVGNLEYVTPSENMRHAYAMGLANLYQGGANRKLTVQQAQAARQACSNGESYAAVGRHMGVSDRTISSVVRKLGAYAHL